MPRREASLVSWKKYPQLGLLINDEKEFGITVHYVDEGIDTGDIILQRTYPISDQDDYSTLLKKAHIECATVLHEALILFYNHQVFPTPQDHERGFYCPMRILGDELIDWNQSSRNIFNFIRALNAPNLGAKSYINQKPITIFKSQLIPNAPNYISTPGVVVGVHKNDIIVKTLDNTIRITDYLFDGKIKIGDRLKNA